MPPRVLCLICDEEMRDRALLQEQLYCELVTVFPRLARTNVVMFTEQWLRFGLGLECGNLRRDMSSREFFIRAQLSLVHARRSLGFSSVVATQRLYEELEAAVRQYCGRIVELFPGRASSQHQRYLAGTLTGLESLFIDETVTNSSFRSEYLEYLGVAVFAGGPLAIPVANHQLVYPAKYKVRTGAPCRVPG